MMLITRSDFVCPYIWNNFPGVSMLTAMNSDNLTPKPEIFTMNSVTVVSIQGAANLLGLQTTPNERHAAKEGGVVLFI
jgi:hypothetical protein